MGQSRKVLRAADIESRSWPSTSTTPSPSPHLCNLKNNERVQPIMPPVFLSKKHSCYAAAAAPRFIGQKKRMKMMLFLLPSSSSLSASLPPRKIAWKSLSCNATSVTPSSFAIKKGLNLVAEKAHCILFLEKCAVHLTDLMNVGHILYSSSDAW